MAERAIGISLSVLEMCSLLTTLIMRYHQLATLWAKELVIPYDSGEPHDFIGVFNCNDAFCTLRHDSV